MVGTCWITCFQFRQSYSIFHYSMENATKVNDDICSGHNSVIDTHREGRFCGRCKEGYGLAAYSYHYTNCIPCNDYGYKNWLIYFTVALLPLTLFYIFMVIFRVSFTSSYINGYVFVIQCILSPIARRTIDAWVTAQYTEMDDRSIVATVLKIYTSTYGIVNLDFFRDVYLHFCLHPQANMLHIISLDYIVAVYPFLLIFITHLVVNLYDRSYLIKLAWKPFKWCLGRFQRQCDIQSSLIQTVATFILLSNVKILGVCFDLLAFTRAYDSTGAQENKLYFYYDANIEYFGREHLPFALLALFMVFIFVFLPLLLLALYPCRCFQKLLNFLGWRCQTLHIFMDIFQGSYKIEPYDLRSFSAFYFLMRFIFLLAMGNISSPFVFALLDVIPAVCTLILAMFQPYKNNIHNKLDMISMFLIRFISIALTAVIIATYIDSKWLHTATILVHISLGLTVIHTINLTFYLFRKQLRYLASKCFTCKKKEESLQAIFIETDSGPSERSHLLQS